jgi:transcriptional regulator with XRE-family HTH domain
VATVERSYVEALRAGLRAYEDRHQLSQAEHARRLNLPQSTVSRFLAGRYTLSARVAQSIAAVHPELRPLLHEWLVEQSA